MKKLQLAVDERNVRRTLKIKYAMLKGKADLGHRVLYMHSTKAAAFQERTPHLSTGALAGSSPEGNVSTQELISCMLKGSNEGHR